MPSSPGVVFKLNYIGLSANQNNPAVWLEEYPYAWSLEALPCVINNSGDLGGTHGEQSIIDQQDSVEVNGITIPLSPTDYYTGYSQIRLTDETEYFAPDVQYEEQGPGWLLGQVLVFRSGNDFYMLPGNPDAGATYHGNTYTADEWKINSFGDEIGQVQGGMEFIELPFDQTQNEWDNSGAGQSSDDGFYFLTPAAGLSAICFCRGTEIATNLGSKKVEELSAGDFIMTMDNGYQPIKWIGGSTRSAQELEAHPNLRAIRIKAGALGSGIPRIDLFTSPQHRLLISSKISQRMLKNEKEVLVAAKHLLGMDGIDWLEDGEGIEYWHFMFDRHEIVFANGAPAESLYTGPQALKALGSAARKEIFELFPNLIGADYGDLCKPARSFVNGRLGRNLAERHIKNGKKLISDNWSAVT